MIMQPAVYATIGLDGCKVEMLLPPTTSSK